MGDKDFFLSPDDAQTLGDIEYMRKPKRVRRTFPQTVGNGGSFESFTEVSSVEDRSGNYKGNSNGNGQAYSASTYNFQPQPAPQAETNGNSSASQEQSAPTPAPRRDNSMDMFRNMARKIRK